MSSGKQISNAWYAVMDFFTAVLSWTCFFFVRKWLLHQAVEDSGRFPINSKFWLGLFFIPVGWLMLYGLVGAYRSLYKKSRLFEFTGTFICSLVGGIVLFFVVLIDDVKNNNYYYYYIAFLCLVAIHFIFTFSGPPDFIKRCQEAIAKWQNLFQYIDDRQSG
jgi:hypothetical protein